MFPNGIAPSRNRIMIEGFRFGACMYWVGYVRLSDSSQATSVMIRVVLACLDAVTIGLRPYVVAARYIL